jgi:lipoprotein-releasing system permease protein
MRYELFLAIRNLRSKRGRRLTRVTTLIAVLGIGVGVGALIVALALANGFRDEMRDKILRGTAHINVMRVDGQPITGFREVAERIKRLNGVVGASATTYDGAVLLGPRANSYAVLRGLDRDSSTAKAELSKVMVEGSVESLFANKEGDLRGVILGAELASRSDLKLGDVAEIVTANPSATSAQPVRRLTRVTGIFRTGLFEYDSTWIYMPLDLAAVLAGSIDRVSVISVQVNDIYKVNQISSKIRSSLGDAYTTINWEEANRPLFAALALERRMGMIVIALIIFIAALNIATTLVLVVVERRADIAILGAIGSNARSIMSIFVIEGAIIGACGALLGVIVGIVATMFGNHFKVVSLPPDVYSISGVPFNIEFIDVLIAASVALLLSLIATIYPALAAARVRPVDMLRDA